MALALGALSVGVAAAAAPDDEQSIYLAHNGSSSSGVLPAGASAWTPQGLPSTVVGVTVNSTGTTAYYVSYSPANVYRVDTATQAVTGTLAVGPNQPWVSGSSIAISPDDSTLYLAGYTNGTVGVVDTATFTVGTPMTFGGQTRGVATSPDGARVYVADHLGNRVLVVDAASGAVTRSISLFNAYSIAVSPSGAFAVSSDVPGTTGRPAVAIYEADGSLRATLPQGAIGGGSGNGVGDLAFSPDGTLLYGVTGASAILEINPATGGLMSQVATNTTNPFGGAGSHLATSSDGERLYLQHQTGVLRYDTAAHALGPTTTSGTQNVEVVLEPDQAPTAAFVAAPRPAGQPSTFDASSSTAVRGDVASYSWDFGDGETLTTSRPETEHTYAAAGTYTVTLTVTSQGGTSTLVVHTGQAVLRNGGPTARLAQTVEVGAPLTVVTPVAPVEVPASCTGNPSATTVEVTPTPGLTYVANGSEVPAPASFVLTAADPVLYVKAVAEPGFQIAPGAEENWTYTYDDPGCVVPPTVVSADEPTVTSASCAGDPDATTIDIPTVTGVTYFADGTEVTGPVTLDAERLAVVVTAAADAGYVLSAPAEWTYEFEAPECVTLVTADVPTERPASCTGDPTTAIVVIPEVTGVTYLADGSPAGAAVRLTAANPSTTITTVAQTGYELTSTDSWTFAFTEPTCPFPVRIALVDPGSQSTAQGSTISLPVRGAASDGSGITYSATGLPTGLTIDPSSGLITGEATTVGTYLVQVTACLEGDPDVCDAVAFDWTVTPAEVPPTPTPGPTTGPSPSPSSSPPGPAPSPSPTSTLPDSTDDQLSSTGTDAAPLAVSALGLLLLGSAAFSAARRRGNR